MQRELGTAMIFVTHDQDEAMSLGDEVFLFHEGRILQQGEPHEVYRRPASRYVAEFFGKTNFIEASAIPDETGCLKLRTREGELATIEAWDKLISGDVVCTIRPEAWHIAGAEGSVHGRVVDRTFIGDRQELLVETALGLQTVLVLGFYSAKIGENVTLAVDPRTFICSRQNPDAPFFWSDGQVSAACPSLLRCHVDDGSPVDRPWCLRLYDCRKWPQNIVASAYWSLAR